MNKYEVVIIGGGIAGTTCAESIKQTCPHLSILLITVTPTVKRVTNVVKQSRLFENFDVEEVPAEHIGVVVLIDRVSVIHRHDKIVETFNSGSYMYDRLCVCTGCSPKVLKVSCPDSVIYLRDLSTVKGLKERMKNCRRIVILGNGGIANELVHLTDYCDVIWAVRHDYINSQFLDEGASRFLLQTIDVGKLSCSVSTRQSSSVVGSDHIYGCSVGSKWQTSLKGCLNKKGCLYIKYNTELTDLVCCGSGVCAVFTDGEEFECDMLVCVIGVQCSVSILFDDPLKLEEEALVVDRDMKTSDPFIYAAGDCVWVSPSDLWFRMRLWSQSKEMGFQAAQSIINSLNLECLPTYHLFQVFSHSTVFFGFKVVLLGLYNSQGLSKDDYVVHLRVDGGEYIKVILCGGKMVGAMLVGNTDLSETFENLIYDQLDLTFMGDQLLAVDIDDYFD